MSQSSSEIVSGRDSAHPTTIPSPFTNRKTLPQLWQQFCNWVTSTNNRLYIGWFGVLMIPTLATAAITFVIAFIAAPPVDLAGTGVPIAGSLLDGNNLITAAVVPSSAAIGLHFYPIWAAASVDEWLYNGGPYQMIVLHFVIGIICYQDREWELSYRLGMRPWISLAFTAPVAAALSVLLIYPIGQGGFSAGMPLGISGTFTFMLRFQADHNILMNPLHQMGVIGIVGGAFCSAVHGSMVTSTLVRRTNEYESVNAGYRFGQKTATYRFDKAQAFQHQAWGRYLTFPNSRSLHFVLAAIPVAGIWSAALGVDISGLNFHRLNLSQPTLYSNGQVVPTWADRVTQANAGLQAMFQSRSQFSLTERQSILPDWALEEATPVVFRQL
jgi:photosystem II P680 reaction center D1 protein